MYPEGEKCQKGQKGSRERMTKSPIGVILMADSFYVKQVLQRADDGYIAMDGKGGATVPWHTFDAGVTAAFLGSSFTSPN